MNDITRIDIIRDKNQTVLVDLVYSPDDNGYYLEKSILPEPSGEIVYYSDDTYPVPYKAIKAYKNKSVAWVRR